LAEGYRREQVDVVSCNVCDTLGACPCLIEGSFRARTLAAEMEGAMACLVALLDLRRSPGAVSLDDATEAVRAVCVRIRSKIRQEART